MAEAGSRRPNLRSIRWRLVCVPQQKRSWMILQGGRQNATPAANASMLDLASPIQGGRGDVHASIRHARTSCGCWVHIRRASQLTNPIAHVAMQTSCDQGTKGMTETYNYVCVARTSCQCFSLLALNLASPRPSVAGQVSPGHERTCFLLALKIRPILHSICWR